MSDKVSSEFAIRSLPTRPGRVGITVRGARVAIRPNALLLRKLRHVAEVREEAAVVEDVQEVPRVRLGGVRVYAPKRRLGEDVDVVATAMSVSCGVRTCALCVVEVGEEAHVAKGKRFAEWDRGGAAGTVVVGGGGMGKRGVEVPTVHEPEGRRRAARTSANEGVARRDAGERRRRTVVVVVVVVVVVGVGVRASGLARVFVVAAEVREPSLVGAVVPARATRRHGVRASDAAEEPGVAIAAADARESVRGRAESRPQADVRLALRCPVVVVSSHARDERRDAVRHGHQRERRHHPSMAPTPAGDLARTHQADARANHHGRLRPRTAGALLVRCWFCRMRSALARTRTGVVEWLGSVVHRGPHFNQSKK